jgi:hypothetical protein
MPNNNALHGDEREGYTYRVEPDAGQKGLQVVAVSNARLGAHVLVGQNAFPDVQVTAGQARTLAWALFAAADELDELSHEPAKHPAR